MPKYLLDIPADLHKRAKVRAAVDGTTLKEIILRALKEYLKKKS